MIKVNDAKKLKEYIEKYQMEELFTKDSIEFMELLHFKKNEFICKDGEELNYIFFFVEGKAKVYTTLQNGKSLLLCFYYSFKVLGDLEFINQHTAVTNVQAVKDAYCIGISVKKTRNQLLEDTKFLRYLCNSLGEKLNRCSRNSSINLLYPLENRLASYIMATGERINDSQSEPISFNENLSELAELLGTSYRHLQRTLNNLTQSGIIEKNNKLFEVINENKLKEMAADLYK